MLSTHQDSVLGCWLKRLIFGSKESLCAVSKRVPGHQYSERAIHLWQMLVNGKPEEHFLTVLHVRSTDAVTIAEALQSLLQQKQLDLRKLIGQGYDGAATFAGKISGVHKRIQTSTAHAIYIYRFCRRLQLISIHAAASGKVVRMFLWNHDQRLDVVLLFSPKTRGIEGHPGSSCFTELKIVKPCDSRWLSHERCVNGNLQGTAYIVANPFTVIRVIWRF